MYQDSETLLSKLLDSSPSLRAEFKNDFKLKKDPRITFIGKFLRRSSLDEIPQFINIFKGDMSLVGPRPIVSEEIEKYGPSMDDVTSVRPGLTGLWQVSGRNNLSYNKRIELDLYYSRHCSLLLDFKIIILTLGVLIFPMDRGAY